MNYRPEWLRSAQESLKDSQARLEAVEGRLAILDTAILELEGEALGSAIEEWRVLEAERFDLLYRQIIPLDKQLRWLEVKQ